LKTSAKLNLQGSGMNEVMQDVQSLRWWFSVVVVSLVVGILAAYGKVAVDSAGMHLAGLRPGTWYRVVPAPETAAAHMLDDLWLEVDGRVQWFGRSTRLEFREEGDPPT